MFPGQFKSGKLLVIGVVVKERHSGSWTFYSSCICRKEMSNGQIHHIYIPGHSLHLQEMKTGLTVCIKAHVTLSSGTRNSKVGVFIVA